MRDNILEMKSSSLINVLRKVACAMVLCIVSCQMAGCSNPGVRLGQSGTQVMNRDIYLSGKQDEQTNVMMKQIITAMDNQDADSLKALFSDYAIKTDPSLDSQIESLFDFYKGPSTSCEGKSDYAEGETSYSDDNSNARGYWLLSGRYTLITASETYQLKIIFYSENRKAPTKEGLSYLEIVTQDYYDQDTFIMQPPDAVPGIYIQS